MKISNSALSVYVFDSSLLQVPAKAFNTWNKLKNYVARAVAVAFQNPENVHHVLMQRQYRSFVILSVIRLFG